MANQQQQKKCNHEFSTQEKLKENFSPLWGFEPLSPLTESKCATNDLNVDFKILAIEPVLLLTQS